MCISFRTALRQRRIWRGGFSSRHFMRRIPGIMRRLRGRLRSWRRRCRGCGQICKAPEMRCLWLTPGMNGGARKSGGVMMPWHTLQRCSEELRSLLTIPHLRGFSDLRACCSLMGSGSPGSILTSLVLKRTEILRGLRSTIRISSYPRHSTISSLFCGRVYAPGGGCLP